uniref:Uncharacterized protein n=1 Tax=Opuntia streptacantha TaxID=393608 RepID=A0A7C9CF15_OPUST
MATFSKLVSLSCSSTQENFSRTSHSSVLLGSWKNHFFFSTETMCARKISPCNSIAFVPCPVGGIASSSITGKPLCVVFFRTSTIRDTFSTPRRLTNGGFTSASSPTVIFLIQGSGFASRKGRPLRSSMIS